MGDQQLCIDAVATVTIKNQTVFYRRARHLQKTHRDKKAAGQFFEAFLEILSILECLEIIDDQISRAVVYIDIFYGLRQLLENSIGNVCFQKTKIIGSAQLIAK